MDSSVVTLILGISSGAVGVLSVLSQFIIVVINNRHQERISKREMFVRRQIEAVENTSPRSEKLSITIMLPISENRAVPYSSILRKKHGTIYDA